MDDKVIIYKDTNTKTTNMKVILDQSNREPPP